jgi:hypothetical protein
MSPEQRRQDLADSEQEIWRVLTLLGMSRETLERTMALKNSRTHEQKIPLPARKPPGRPRITRPD